MPEREHTTDGADCWCEPSVFDGVVIHRRDAVVSADTPTAGPQAGTVSPPSTAAAVSAPEGFDQ